MSDLFLDVGFLSSLKWLVPVSVLGASLVGSPHCLAMCGPLALNFAREGRRGMMAYQIGRATSYTLAGSVAGALGGVGLGIHAPPWLSLLTLLMIALALIVSGTRAFTNRAWHLPMPEIPRRFFQRILRGRFTPARSAYLGGMLTVFLPCGHLYGFLAGAMTTGSALGGAIFMVTFWLGTVPALGFGMGGLGKLLQPGFKRHPRWAGTLLILAGLISLMAFAANLSLTESKAESGSTLKTGPILCHQ